MGSGVSVVSMTSGNGPLGLVFFCNRSFAQKLISFDSLAMF